MSNTSKWVVGIIVAIIVIGGMVLSAKNNDDASTAANDEVKTADVYKVGVMLPLTGDGASVGEPSRNAIGMAAEEINNAGGINGSKLELIIEDSKCNGKDGASAAQKLINVDKVAIILGGACSSESLAAVPLATSSKVTMLSGISSSPALTGASQFFARNYPSDDYQATVLAEQANKLGWKKVAILQEQTDYASGINKAFVTKYQALGGTVVREEFPTAQTDFKTSLSKLRGENADALFLIAQTSTSGERVLKQIQDLGWKPQLMVSDVVASEASLLTTYSSLMEGAYSALFSADATSPRFQKFSQDYKAKYGKDLTQETYAQTTYDAVYMIKDAIAQVGYDGPKLAQWLHSIKDWQGVSGSTAITANGDRTSGHRLVVVKNGKAETVK